MAIDIRATVTCSLGTLISASLSDDYVQGNGLVKCKGSCEIAGIITPAIGTVVTFSYTKGGVTRSIPRKLRVLSSFADPFRRTTKVELGDKLTYLADLKEPVNWKAFDDPENASYSEADAEVITLPIHASSVMDQCLSQLGLTASSNPLQSQFSIAKFDFGPGYVQVLGDLLVSESYCGYLNENEVLQVFALSEDGGTGPVVDSTSIIDLGSIGVGQLPGEAVTVSYSTLKLKQPDANAEPLWERVRTSNKYTIPISYTKTDGTQAIREYNILDRVEVENTYQLLTMLDETTQRMLVRRKTTTKTQAAAVIGGLVAEYLSNGITFNNGEVQFISAEEFIYDNNGNEIFYERKDSGSAPYLHGTAGVPWVFSATDYVNIDYANIFPIERERRYTSIAGNWQQVETLTYGPWAKTIAGQQSIASARESFTTAAQVSAYLNKAYPGGYAFWGDLQLIDHRITTEDRREVAGAPDQADVLNAQYAKGGNASNGYRTESKAELELALGSATAQRRVEFSLPYAPDDVFTKAGSSYSAVGSAAEAVANRYGRVQNKLLLGNRNGANFQLAPEVLPAAPFAPFIVQANGLSALYRNNGTSWTMDANGVVVSTDALFWGAVGGTGTFWFPVAPGVTTLPTTPAVVNGQMTVSKTVPPYNEKVLASSRLRVGVSVESLNYPLAQLTAVNAIRVRTGISVTKVVLVNVPLSTISVAAQTPAVALGAVVRPPATSVAVAAVAPEVAIDTVVAVPATSMAVAALAPAQAGPDGADVAVPLTTISLNALVPDGVGANIETFFNSYVPQVYGTDAWVYPDWWAD